MIPFVITSLFAFVAYMLFTAGSGDIGLWSRQEILFGVILSVAAGVVSGRIFCKKRAIHFLNPLRWIQAILYVVGPFLFEMAKANFDVAYRVITGRIRPGIVRVKSGMNTDLGVLMLANSITLTPGTLTVDIEDDTNDLFVHIINVPVEFDGKDSVEAKEVFSTFDCPRWIRRIAE